MQFNIRRSFTFIEERFEEEGRRADTPLRTGAAVIVIDNPFLGGYVEDMGPAIKASAEIGRHMGKMLTKILDGGSFESYGKGGIVGVSGVQEHANALLTTEFANPIRDALGGANAWISSFTKVAAPNATIDIPMNHKNDVYVRSHYNGVTLTLPGTPMADEIALIFCVATRGRLNARVGGLTHDDVEARLAQSK